MDTYEKKYKEALEWMREIYPTMTGCDKEDAERHFPELKESEDERMRKALIDFVRHNERGGYRIYNNVSTVSMIDYLERQRPINPTMIEKERIDNAFTKMMLKGQKPIGWSEEDNRKIKFLVNLVNEWCDKAPNATSMVKEEMSDWLKSLKARCSWKPTEKQIKALEDGVAKLGLYYGEHLYNNDSYTNLKLLLEQLKAL